jgi:4'-phosphopantetheinyl transferase
MTAISADFHQNVEVDPRTRAAADASTASGLSRAWIWDLPPKTAALQHDEVHVWLADLNHLRFRPRDVDRILSHEERERAARFYLQRDRNHFTAGRAVLRSILARYLNIDPSRVQFSRGPHGKPVLTTDGGGDALCFNLSHSSDVALCAVARGRDVGVDVERVRADINVDLIAERFFSEREIAALRLLPPENKQKAFFTCWVRKEAYLKAKGDGLAMGLDGFSVSFLPGEPAALLDVPGHPEEALAWSLRELDFDPSYAAALAVRAGEYRMRCRQFTADPPDLLRERLDRAQS